MIAKVKMSNNPKALLKYIFSDKENGMEHRAEHIASQYCSDNAKEIDQEWDRYLKNGKREIRNPAMHIIFSLAPGETMNRGQLHDFLFSTVTEKFGLHEYAWTAVRHMDTDSHEHIHIAVCRKSPLTGKTLSDSQTYFRGMGACREAETKYGLRQIDSSYEKKIHSDERKQQLRSKIEDALKISKTFNEFKMRLLTKGITTIVGRGISFVDDKGMRVKGSDKQIGFSYSKIMDHFKEKQQDENIGLSKEKQYDVQNVSNEVAGSTNISLRFLDGLLGAIAADTSGVPTQGAKPHDDSEEEAKKRKMRMKKRKTPKR